MPQTVEELNKNIKLFWEDWCLGNSIFALLLLVTTEGSKYIPPGFQFNPPQINHIWDTAPSVLSLRRNYKGTKFTRSCHDQIPCHSQCQRVDSRVHATPFTENIVCTTSNKYLLFLIKWHKNKGYPADLNVMVANNRKEYLSFVSAETQWERCDAVQTLNCAMLPRYPVIPAGTQVFDIYDFLKDPVVYFTDFLNFNNLPFNDDLEHYVNLVYSANEKYITEILYIESFLDAVLHKEDTPIKLSTLQETILLSMLCTRYNFDITLENIPEGEFKNTRDLRKVLSDK